MTDSGSSGTPSSLTQLIDNLRSDPLARMRLISRLADALIEAGADPSELTLLGGIESRVADPELSSIVVFSKTDTGKNTESFIVG